ncbi:hypothetical protein IFM89_033883 [Coptis chinensis]|uniref:Uncharacterized protein n=1 Tax=Coptis chinensis TaxID=261450 RepID=A0A835H231_9MAGN|nr:hypothetical protein IFM89_033883 [Coptis chinensis]
MTNNKNRVRRTKSSWLCFGPVSCTGSDKETDHDLGPVYMKVVKEDNPKKMKSTSEKMIVGRSQKRSPRRIFSRIAKAVFFEASMKKSRKVQQDPYHILRNLSTKNEKISDVKSSRKLLKNPKIEEGNSKNSSMGTSSFRFSSSNSSCTSSSTESSSTLSSLSEQKNSKSFRSISFEPKQNALEDLKPKTIKKIYSSTANGLFLLLMSLMCLIFWGRVCAIICTSTWIYFSPLRRKTEDEDEEVVEKKIEKERMESREYKKRVVMEGFLERSHSRV